MSPLFEGYFTKIFAKSNLEKCLELPTLSNASSIRGKNHELFLKPYLLGGNLRIFYLCCFF